MQTRVDGWVSLLAGVDTSLPADALPSNSLALAGNASLRFGKARTRPAFRECLLVEGPPVESDLPANAQSFYLLAEDGGHLLTEDGGALIIGVGYPEE